MRYKMFSFTGTAVCVLWLGELGRGGGGDSDPTCICDFVMSGMESVAGLWKIPWLNQYKGGIHARKSV